MKNRTAGRRTRWVATAALFLAAAPPLAGQGSATPAVGQVAGQAAGQVVGQRTFGARPVISIQRVDRPPAIADFLSMAPSAEVTRQLAKVEGMIQREPVDGAPVSQRTEVYLGYDDENLYAIFLCYEDQPGKIRARMDRRENIFGDDIVSIQLDTFADQRRAYVFTANPYGVQLDAVWVEGQGFDLSFDTVWHTEGQLTGGGYVVLYSIPFKSLRFPAAAVQSWGILLTRDIIRDNEEAFWPRYTSRIEGRLNQMGTLTGLENISPGRNAQIIPYGFFRSLDSLAGDKTEGTGGVDAKVIIRDSLVLDLTANPDFSQVESDNPQVTANQRFDVFFPEKRPFFLENASFFQTPINLVFTRNIADPQFGVRLTGKAGPYALGALIIDDQAPGKTVPAPDPRFGDRASFGIFRVNRDVGRQSNLGVIYTAREFGDDYNRVGGVDGRWKYSDNWASTFQAVQSATRENGVRTDGPALAFNLVRGGRQFNYSFAYRDRDPEFVTESGFVPRVDMRASDHDVSYTFRPEGKLISWGPRLAVTHVWDYSGLRLDQFINPWIEFQFTRQTNFAVAYNNIRERLRPIDFPVLLQPKDFHSSDQGVSFGTAFVTQVSLNALYIWGRRVNFVPAPGQEPFLASFQDASVTLTLRPVTRLVIDNTYLLSALNQTGGGPSIFNNHIARSKWNWQFTRELSLRFIAQYDALLVDETGALTSLETRKNFNADVLLTYLVNPWTALFVGYNSNARVLDPAVPSRFTNDARQFFAKFSYLIRF